MNVPVYIALFCKITGTSLNIELRFDSKDLIFFRKSFIPDLPALSRFGDAGLIRIIF
jgi:hypothetical protein